MYGKRHSFLCLKWKGLWLPRTKHRLPVSRQDLAGRYFHHISCHLDKTKSNLYAIAYESKDKPYLFQNYQHVQNHLQSTSKYETPFLT